MQQNIADLQANKFKETSRSSPKILYGNLLDKIITSYLKDQAIIRR